MPYLRGTFTGEKARRIARLGSVSGRSVRSCPWWPEAICNNIEKIVWRVYCLGGEPGDDWHEFIAYDGRGEVLAIRRVEGY
jgi:hypothetical protein